MTFVDKLNKVCEKCTANTKKVYLQNIRRLYRFLDADGEVPTNDSKWLEHKTVIKKYDALPFNIRRALSVAGLKAARAYGIDTDKWYKRLLNDQTLYRENRNKNKRTKEEDAKMLKGGTKELKKISAEYKRQINRELKADHNLKTLYKYMLYLILRLFVEFPARNDFPSVQLVESKTGNYVLYKKRKKATFVLKKYKNSDKLGPREIEISAPLTRVLKEFIKYREGLVEHDFLLSNAAGKPLSRQAFSKAVHKITSKLSGKSFGSRILRILHATENEELILKSKELSNKMLHTKSQTEQYVKKK